MSSIPGVKASLVTILKAALPLTDVIYGPPGAVQASGQRALFVGAARGVTDFTALDQGSGAERYNVELTARVSVAGNDQQSADERALADFNTACVAVNAAVFAEGLEVSAIGEFELGEIVTENGTHAAVRFNVRAFSTSL